MPETTPNYHHVPVAKKKKGNPLRTITITKGIKALYDYKQKIVVTYLFDVDQYTMKQAKEWVKKHKASVLQTQAMDNLFLANQINELYSEIRSEVTEKLDN